jgi:hypothetical protein
VLRKPSNLRQALWGGWTCPHCRGEFDRWGRRTAPVRPAFATDPGGLAVSPDKLRVLRPELFGASGLIHGLKVRVGLEWDQLGYIDEHLGNGDSRAAVVMSTGPLLVAAYTDELDGVAVLRFPGEFVDEYQLRPGSRLLTVNTYTNLAEPDEDVVPGPKASGRWNGFNPIIADFVSDDLERIEELKHKIEPEEWQRAQKMGEAFLRRWPGVARDGRPVLSGIDAKVAGNT